MSGRKSFYITTPIYYVNDSPHIGHAYTSLACDVLARFKRLDGFDVMFLTGTDEHGQKVEKAAAAKGLDPLEFCDQVSDNFRALSPLMNFSNDGFIRTTEARHTAASQAIWQGMVAAGDIYLGVYSGWYAVRDEAYYAEDELNRADDGKLYAPSGAAVEWLEEPSYFFRLSAWGDRLLAHYDANPDFVLPASRRNEVISFVKQGLNDLSVSRSSFTWGVPVPGDPDHVMYVWVDALTNYITAQGYPDQGDPRFRQYWPADVHMVGKDIVRFHAIYWPAFLMSAGVAPPKRVYAHGWWTIEGRKMSKSLNNAIAPQDLVDEYGLDQTRYFLMREVPFGNDGDFSRRAMINRINSDLANDYGNLVQRVLSMIGRNCGAAVPTPGAAAAADQALLSRAHGLLDQVRTAIEVQQIHRALTLIWEVIGDANRYVDHMAPWELRKSDPDRMATVLYQLAEVIRHLGILTQPFVPDSAGRILDQLSVPAAARGFTDLGPAGALTPGTALPKPQGIFPRFVEQQQA